MRFPHHAAKTGQRLSYTQLLHMRRLLLIFSTSFILYSCDPGRNALTGKVDAYVPVYNSLSDVQKISVVAQQPTLLAGKIYAYKNYIFQKHSVIQDAFLFLGILKMFNFNYEN